MARKLFLASLSLGVLVPLSFALAQNITFPIDELGGCNSKDECRAYCEAPANMETCLSFGERNGLMSAEEAARARKLSKLSGPAGCRGKECKTYCNDSAHFEECRAFAQERGLTPPGGKPPRGVKGPQIDENRAMQAIEAQGGPGGCKTKDACRTYCSSEGNMKECFAFAKEHKLMSDEDIARAERFANQEGPGGCRGESCKDYCENPEHAEKCIAFAEKNDFIKHEEAEKAKKFIGKTGPGGCRGAECKTYCEDPAHREGCMQFAIENGLMSQENMERMRGPESFGGPGQFSGPGGCSSEEECRAFCEANPDKCRAFGQGPGEQGPDHAVGQERAIERRGFEMPPGFAEKCKENPEECRKRFEEQGTTPRELMQMDESERRMRMNKFLGRPEGGPQNQVDGKSRPFPLPQQEGEGPDMMRMYQLNPQYRENVPTGSYAPPESPPPPSALGPGFGFVASVFSIFSQLVSRR